MSAQERRPAGEAATVKTLAGSKIKIPGDSSDGRTPEDMKDLEIAMGLVRAGVPVFCAPPVQDQHGEWLPHEGAGGYRLPCDWQHTSVGGEGVRNWRPGYALCAVMSHVVDAVDVDLQHDGQLARIELEEQGKWPRPYGTARTPSGGTHDLVSPLGVGSPIGILQGIDIRGGVDGKSMSFIFIAPTKRESKTTNEIERYSWTVAPHLDDLDPNDTTGHDLVQIAAQRGRRGTAQAQPVWSALPDAHKRQVEEYLGGVLRRMSLELDSVADWDEGRTDDWGRGWEKMLSDTCYRLGSLARASWTGWTLESAEQSLRVIVPDWLASAVNVPMKWAQQSRRGEPAYWPAALDTPPTPTLYQDGWIEDAPAGRPRHSGQVLMAERLAVRAEGQLLHVHGIGWHWWDGSRWAPDQGKAVARRAVLAVLADALVESMRDHDLRRDVQKCESDSGLDGVLGVAASLSVFSATVQDMDALPHLLNCANGTMNLLTRRLQPPKPEDRLTKMACGSYLTQGADKLFATVLETVLPDEKVRRYLQLVAGQAVYGQVEQHLFPILTGTGANGKGTVYAALRHALGDYAVIIDPELLMARDRAGTGGPEMLQLRGARLVIGSETNDGRKLDEALMKRLTGGDELTARGLYKDPVSWLPSHQFLYITNHLPKVSGDAPAVWRRVRVVPFNVVMPEDQQDPRLGDKLLLAKDEVLTWAVDGYFQYVDAGRQMEEPEAVRVATATYQVESDDVRQFLNECCEEEPDHQVGSRDLYQAYRDWCEQGGRRYESEVKFAGHLRRLGYDKKKTSTRAVWLGLKIME
ncbi:phage/plasmid primase, P4 family [Allobranchiibius sp. GilTou38]|uniref:phage/plasmid primase, P4 family n=1 Tax=Allobranchiibius sp. GilTou38 TaxID=2815210 RepID=UPI001AA19486|nr:phage/plasmid primase, P4 family [Allobranchiibius sp. GilTou38]MBO1765804.1 hypothetical protein [Allobranchiibius sp. GilTou38]